MKTCSKCCVDKPLEAFYRDNSRKDGYEFKCKTCSKADQKQRTIATRSGVFTRPQYDALLIAQQNKCAICGDGPQPGGSLYVDHRHEDGRLRGLLCNRCNSGLGCFLDSADMLRNAALYLESYPRG